MLEKDHSALTLDLRTVERAQKLSWKASIPLALLSAGALALGYDVAGVAGGLLTGVCALSGLVAGGLVRHDERRLAVYDRKLERAEAEMQEAHLAVHGKYTPDYEVKLLSRGIRAAGGAIAQSQGLLSIGGVRLRTR